VIVVHVIGSIALDVIARREGYQPGTSNPARIEGSVGGVGYSIYSRLTSPRRLITVVGNDSIGSVVRERIAGDPGIVVVPTALPTSVYLALMDHGELLYGAADMEGIRRSLHIDAVSRELAEVRDSDFVVLEANLSPELTAALLASPARRYSTVFECVSVEKAHGVALTQAHRHTEIAPPRRVDCGDTTGAGDALVAGVVDALAQGADVTEAIPGAMEAVVEYLEERR